MPKMAHVVFDEEAQRHRLVLTDSTGDLQRRRRHPPNDVCEMAIVENPEIDQFAPWTGVIVLRAHPEVLFVSGKLETRRVLCPHKALVVVGGGVDEMADNLLHGPDLRRGLRGSRFFAD